MKVLVIPDDCHITRVPENENYPCKGCVFETIDEDAEGFTFQCAMDYLFRVPCVDTIYAIVERDDEEEEEYL